MTIGELGLRISVLCLFIFLFIVSLFIPHGVSTELGAAFWPRVLTATAILISGFLSVEGFIKLRRQPNETPASKGGKKAVDRGTYKMVSAVIGAILYVALLPLVGFPILTAVFGMFLIRMMGYKKVVVIVATGIFVALLLAVVFGKVMAVPLPKGVWLFRQLTSLIY